MDKNNKKKKELYLRNVIFGVEDSLVSTVGLVSGISVAGVAQDTILLTGFVLILVEAFSMGVGSLLTEHSVEEYAEKKETSLTEPVIGGSIMFVSYLSAGVVPLLPYLFTPPQQAIWFSNALSLMALFTLGAISARIFHINMVRHGLEMLFWGGVATVVGIAAGTFLRI